MLRVCCYKSWNRFCVATNMECVCAEFMFLQRDKSVIRFDLIGSRRLLHLTIEETTHRALRFACITEKTAFQPVEAVG